MCVVVVYIYIHIYCGFPLNNQPKKGVPSQQAAAMPQSAKRQAAGQRKAAEALRAEETCAELAHRSDVFTLSFPRRIGL